MASEFELTIEKPAAGGRMIARHEGRVILVSGAIPGERVRAEVERVGKGVMLARTVEVLEASPDRRAVTSEWLCGGAYYAHIVYARQTAIKREVLVDAFARIGRVTLDQPPAVAASPERGYRMRARLHVKGSRVGFFREGTHELCDAEQTGQLLPVTNGVLEELASALRACSSNLATSIEIAENVPASQRAVHLELSRDASKSDVAVLSEAALDRITGVSGQRADVRRVDVWRGEPWVTDTFDVRQRPRASASAAAEPPELTATANTARIELRRETRSFFQANRYLTQALVDAAMQWVDGRPAIDLYAGVGLFAIAAAASGSRPVVAVEASMLNVRDLKFNARPFADVVRVRHAPVEAFVSKGFATPSTVLVIDPPRTGMSREAASGVNASGAERLVYVSCDAATLARDVRTLIDGGYRLVHVEAFDLFPNTPHAEALVVLER